MARRADIGLYAIAVALALLLGGLYVASIDLRAPDASFEVHNRIVDGTAGSPYRYRILVPLILETFTRLFSAVSSADDRATAFLHASALFDCFGLSVQFIALTAWLRKWFPPVQVLVGVAFVASVSIATFSYFTYQPWSILEVAFFAFGFLFAHQRRWGWLTLMVVLAALNRETGVFLPLALLFSAVPRIWVAPSALWRAVRENADVQRGLGLTILSTAIFAILRVIRGSSDPVDQLHEVISRNLIPDNLIAAALVVGLFLGLGWIYAVLGRSRAPDELRRLSRVVVFYLAAFAVWGWWREARILTSLYPILVPLLLAYCYRDATLPLSAEQYRAAGDGDGDGWALENSNL